MSRNKIGRESKPKRRLNKKEITAILMKLFQSNKGKELATKTIFMELKLKTHPSKMLCLDALENLLLSEFVVEVSNGKYRYNPQGNEMIGIFYRRSNGRHYFVADGTDKQIDVSEVNSMRAMNNDKVKVIVTSDVVRERLEAEVIEIIERSKDNIVGVLDVSDNFAFLVTDNKFVSNDIFIPKDKLNGGKTGDKAVVRVIGWKDNDKNPTGEVIDILGKTGDNDTEMHAILAEFGLPYKYPEIVELAANNIDEGITKEEISKREDFRDILTVTIDPKDAKDFDDAISIRRKSEDIWEVGVHIADVTHYIEEGDIIDREAEKRATSVYLVDRTIPMLPERLCNFICSLRPDEEKLAYSVIYDITEGGEIKKSRVAKTVIKSDRRFTYEEAQQILEDKAGEYAEELLMLDKIAKALREKRFKNGAINFDRFEVKFEIDEKGKPISVYFKESKDAHKLVEEFMLIANKTVAELIGRAPKGQKPKVFPYRIHDLPDPERLDNLLNFTSKFGYRIRTSGSKNDVSKSINKMLDEVSGKKESNLIETVTIRAMQKAKYSTENIGHYGLAFDYYTHFTSPIRRFPDMMVHRLLAKYLAGGKSVSEKKYEDLCKHSSDMEQIAANAERASVKYKQVEFMLDNVGKVYDGVISGLTDWGIYVEINENKCEGMVSLRELDDDYYMFDEKNYCIRGRKNKKVYSLGDEVRIKVAAANLEKKQLDFDLVE